MPLLHVMPNPVFQGLDDNGRPLAGGRLWSYVTGTQEPLPLYTDANGRSPHPNPILLDARGEAKIYGRGIYKLKLLRPDDTEVWTMDPVHFMEISDFWLQILNQTGPDGLGLHDHEHSTDPQPVEAPDGHRTGFSTEYRYRTGTLEVWLNGVLQLVETHYQEDRHRRSYNFTFAPYPGDTIQHRYILDEARTS
jgi:hypothetical protein